MAHDLTLEQFQKVLPKQVKKAVDQNFINGINLLISDPDMRINYRDNLLSYTGVMRDGKYKIVDYVNAVRYVSFKLLGDTDISAYTKAFPTRFQRMVNMKKSSKDIASFVSAYNRNKLVNAVFEQTIIPSHILNADLYQKALNTQAELMVGAVSEKVRCDAANSILIHLKAPETQKIELDIGLKENKTIEELRNSTLELVAQQREMIRLGHSNAGDIAKSNLLIEDGEIVG